MLSQRRFPVFISFLEISLSRLDLPESLFNFNLAKFPIPFVKCVKCLLNGSYSKVSTYHKHLIFFFVQYNKLIPELNICLTMHSIHKGIYTSPFKNCTLHKRETFSLYEYTCAYNLVHISSPFVYLTLV